MRPSQPPAAVRQLPRASRRQPDPVHRQPQCVRSTVSQSQRTRSSLSGICAESRSSAPGTCFQPGMRLSGGNHATFSGTLPTLGFSLDLLAADVYPTTFGFPAQSGVPMNVIHTSPFSPDQRPGRSHRSFSAGVWAAHTASRRPTRARAMPPRRRVYKWTGHDRRRPIHLRTPVSAPVVLQTEESWLGKMGLSRKEGRRQMDPTRKTQLREEFGLINAWQALHEGEDLPQTLRWTSNKSAPFHCRNDQQRRRAGPDRDPQPVCRPMPCTKESQKARWISRPVTRSSASSTATSQS